MKRTIYSLLLMMIGCSIVTAQEISVQTERVDITHIEAELTPHFASQSISGALRVDFTMMMNDTIVRLDARNMSIESQTDYFKIEATDKHIQFIGDFEKGQTYTAIFSYKATPSQALYFVNNRGKPQLWAQGQGKYTSYWLPSIDDMNDKIEFDLSFVSPLGYTVSSNGPLIAAIKMGSTKVWRFDMDNPISSYLVTVVMGDYESFDIDLGGNRLMTNYYYPEDSLKVAPTYRYSKAVFDYFETEIGVPFPWKTYRQVPVKDFLYAGMENAGCTVFSDSFVIDSTAFVDRNYVNVNAHELAHQWFGNLVTETKSDHHWLHEGFATYYALLAERTIFGDDYFYWKLYESAEQLRTLSEQGRGQVLVASGGSSLTYYQKGAWAVHILREKVGATVFAEAVKNYLTKYRYGMVTTQDFLKEVSALSPLDLSTFQKDWLYQQSFQSIEALESLKKSSFMREYFKIQALRPLGLEAKSTVLIKAINSGNEYLAQEAVYQLVDEPLEHSLPLYRLVMQSEDTVVRQAIVTSLSNIPTGLAPLVTQLLDDPSYVTQERSLLLLWLAYNTSGELQSQLPLLDKMNFKFGFQDGNIRTLWLALALATKTYKNTMKPTFLEELTSYTAPKQPFGLRENAFSYLYQIQSFNSTSFTHLIEAGVHPVWRFRESARNLLKTLLKTPQWSAYANEHIDELPIRQREMLNNVLNSLKLG